MTLNRHWPNLFKVNPSTPSSQKYEVPNHSDISSQNTGMAIKNEEQNPEPKPRWNPKPEQVQILESIFNSGMKNPSREEIQRIRMSLQQYGEVGDANVFYWFQNRKSRTKQKKRRLEAAAAENPNPIVKRFPSSLHHSKNSVVAGNNASNSIQNNVGGPSYSTLISSVPFHGQYMDQQQKQQIEQISTDQHINIQAAGVEGILSEGTCSDSTAGLSYLPQANSSLLLNEAQSFPTYLDQLQSTLLSSSLPDTNIIHSGDQGEDFITVFIDHVPFRAPRGPVNVKVAFGKNAVLFDSSGQQVMMNEWGFSLQGLQNGAMYYLICLYHAYDGYCS